LRGAGTRDTWFFAALFVHPDYQGGGVGRELLDRAWSGSFARRITITDPYQPRSNGLYARRGLVPTTPILSLAGTSAATASANLVDAPPDSSAIARIDRAAYGFDRTPDHLFWDEQKGAPTLWTNGDEPLGYAYAAASGFIGPLAAWTPSGAAEILRSELARRVGEQTTVLVPGSARALIETALGAGLRFNRPPGLLLLSEGCPVPDSLAISGYWLY
jgi:hypothetical protein